MSERLESIAEELNRKFQGLTDVDKQGTSAVMNYMENLGKSIDAKFESLERSNSEKMAKIMEGTQMHIKVLLYQSSMVQFDGCNRARTKRVIYNFRAEQRGTSKISPF